MSDEFAVVPDDLDKLATAMKSLSGQSENAKKYVTGYFDIDGEQSRLFGYVKSRVGEVRADLEGNYEKLSRLSDSSATELTKSAQMYRTTDTDRAKQMDTQYRTGR